LSLLYCIGWASKAVGRPGSERGKKKEADDSSGRIPHGPRGGAHSGKEQEAALEKTGLAVGGGQVFFCLSHGDPDFCVTRKTALFS